MRGTAWILDVGHRSRRVECDVPAGQRPLEAIEAAVEAALGVAPGLPIGGRSTEQGSEWMFLAPRAMRQPEWLSPVELAATDAAGFALYVEAMLAGWAPPAPAFDVFYFGDTPEFAARLAHLVMKGVKRGTATWVAAAERDGYALGTPGLVSIVTDGFGHALCAIRIERVERVRFGDIGASHAWIEGEGDRTLAEWRAGHLRYFGAEAARLGLVFDDDALVNFEHFTVIAVFGRVDNAALPYGSAAGRRQALAVDG